LGTSISILKNKKQSTYETLFKEIKKMQINLGVIRKLLQLIFIVILNKVYLMPQKKFFPM